MFVRALLSRPTRETKYTKSSSATFRVYTHKHTYQLPTGRGSSYSMEAHKERAEQLEMEKDKEKDAGKESKAESPDSAASKAIRASLEGGVGVGAGAVVEDETDVLVFSRAVNKTDSSLE